MRGGSGGGKSHWRKLLAIMLNWLRGCKFGEAPALHTTPTQATGNPAEHKSKRPRLFSRLTSFPTRQSTGRSGRALQVQVVHHSPQCRLWTSGLIDYISMRSTYSACRMLSFPAIEHVELKMFPEEASTLGCCWLSTLLSPSVTGETGSGKDIGQPFFAASSFSKKFTPPPPAMRGSQE